jgi:hypothetical protein
MNEREIAGKIAEYLDSGVSTLKQGTVYRLQLAREHALTRLAEPERATELAAAGAGGGTWRSAHRLADVRFWIGILLICGTVLFYQYWKTAQQTRDLVETDSAILVSDLPIEAYVDRGFQNWLTRSEP